MRTTILIHYKRGLDRPVGYGLCFLAARALPIFCLRAMAKARGRYLSLGCPFSRCSAGLAAGGLLREVGCDGRPLRRWPQGVSLTRIAKVGGGELPWKSCNGMLRVKKSHPLDMVLYRAGHCSAANPAHRPVEVAWDPCLQTLFPHPRR